MAAGTTGWETAAFAGRAVEFSALKSAAADAQGGRFALVLISGEAGIGKTRLAEETCNFARPAGFEVATGRCFDTQSRLSYFPFIQAFRQFVPRGSPPLPSEEKDGATRADAAPEIIARLRTPRSTKLKSGISSAAQTELFESVACFLRARSQVCPLVLVIEDLDWADEGSLSLLVHLVRTFAFSRRADAPTGSSSGHTAGTAAAHLLIIATCRGNPTPQRTELIRTITECGRHRECRRIRLKRLAESEAASLIDALLGPELTGETKRLAADIGRLTNGNPLFIQQIVRHLAETGRLFRSGGRWVAASGWESKLAAEDGMREVVDARLSRLSDRCRTALSHAAVLGEEFELEVLARMLPFAARDLAHLLDEASAAEVIIEARNDETADYAFAHGLIRQSLYERQSRPAKRTLHSNAAHAIEAVHCDDLDPHLPQLALHYSRAGRAGDLAKAAEYSMRAGEAAFTVCAYADAACHWRTALKLASANDRELRAQLLERLGEASLHSAATPVEAAQHLQAALKLYTELGQEPDIARVHASLVTVISLLSMNPAAIDVGRAVTHSRRAEKLLAVRADPDAEGDLLIGEALVAHAQFRTDDGLVASKRAMEIAELADDAGNWCQAAAFHGHFLWASGRLKEGLALMEQAFERAERLHVPRPRFAAAWLLGFSHLLLWDPAAAERTIQPALTDSDTGQVEFLRQVLVAHLGIVHVFTGALAQASSLLAIAPHRFLEANLRFLQGEWIQAEDLWSQQIDQSHLAQSNQQHWTASLWLARLKRVQGDHTRALDLLTHTPLMAESLLRIPEEILTRSELVLVRIARAEVAEARSEVRRCRTLLNPNEDWRALSAFVDRAEAAVLAHDGFLDEASNLWRLAGKGFSKYRLPWEVAETLVAWGTLLQRHGKTEEAAANLDAAGQIYRHLDLGPRWHERIEELLGPRHAQAAITSAGSPATLGGAGMLPSAAAPVPPSSIHSIASTQDVALLATLIHDAIAHLMNAIDKAAKLRAPIERIAEATEKISRISTPVERLMRALEQAGRSSTANLPRSGKQRALTGRPTRQRLNRSHDPGRPL